MCSRVSFKSLIECTKGWVEVISESVSVLQWDVGSASHVRFECQKIKYFEKVGRFSVVKETNRAGEIA